MVYLLLYPQLMLLEFYINLVVGVLVGLPIDFSFLVAIVVLLLCASCLSHQANHNHICTEVATVSFCSSITLFSYGMAFHTYSSQHRRMATKS